MVVQFPFQPGAGPREGDPLAVGQVFSYSGRDYTVTESDTATCIAVRGQFPELVQVKDEHFFLNASGPSGQLMSGEFWEGGHQWFDGVWMDPFTMTIDRLDGSRR